MGRVITSQRVPCHYCQQEVGIETNPFTKDHVVPRGLGGLDVRWNVVPACRDCNREKADKYPTHACAFCSRSRRRHWEMLGINHTSPKLEGWRKKV